MKQVRNTQAKTEIIAIIEESDTALSHSDIQEKLDSLCNRVTIYRVLDRLEEEGKIHKFVNVDGVVNFAKCTNCATVHHHNHVHFNCERCKAVTCIHNAFPDIPLPTNYIIHQYNLVVSGICANCLDNQLT